MILMFGVGTHFSIRDLVAVRGMALPGAFTQIIVATALGAGVATLWGWSLGVGIIFGFVVISRKHGGVAARTRGSGHDQVK